MSFQHVAPTSIKIDRETRQRRDLGNLDDLKSSILSIGLLNPVIIDREMNLIAGERRLTAILELGLATISVQFFDDLTPLLRHQIELEENIKRKQLTWQEEALAVQQYHLLMKEQNPDWSQAQTAENLGMARKSVNVRLLVAEHFEDEKVPAFPELTTAFNYIERKLDRKTAQVTNKVEKAISNVLELPTTKPAAPPPPPIEDFAIIQGNFLSWQKTFDGEPFNFIHCDFPYGVSTGDQIGQSAAKLTGTYDDSLETYAKLLNCFCHLGPNVLAEQCHLMFWFSMDYYEITRFHLNQAGWNVLPHPLVWLKSDNAGILPDHRRGPRRIYETAFFASRGDRKIVQAVANAFASPTTRDYHTSEKPTAMLSHFYRMLVDTSTRILDPTCGSGNSIKAARALKANSGLGIELNPQFALTAQENLAKP